MSNQISHIVALFGRVFQLLDETSLIRLPKQRNEETDWRKRVSPATYAHYEAISSQNVNLVYPVHTQEDQREFGIR